MFILYDIFYTLFVICYLPIFLIKGKCHQGFLMRLGIFPQSAINKIKGRKVIWLHTVSVGEAQAADNLVKNLKREYPDFSLVISTVTKTGNKIARKLIGRQDLVIYFPLDISFIVKKVISAVNPKLFIIAETEIWPNLIINLAKKGVPIALVNGRVSSNSFRGYKIIRPFLSRVLGKFTLFCMQTKEDAQRIAELGAARAKVKVTGNMKFDLQLSATGFQLSDLGLIEEEKLFIAGSTHRGEEEIVLQAYKELIKNYPNLRLLIAPRHIERVREIEGLISRFGFKLQKVSQLNLDERRAANGERRILVLDTIGQLKNIYALAEVVFIGGSLIRHGGQNPIEAAEFSKPILFGPYMFNFSDIARAFLSKGAAIVVKDARQLKDTSNRLLKECLLRKELGQRAKDLVEENRGASFRNMELIRKLI